MMAAAARTSGTSAPLASVLNRGVIASWRPRTRSCSRARAAARARASVARRVLEALAEYAGFLRVVAVAVALVRRADAFRVVAASTAAAGTQTATPSSAATRRTL